MDNYISEAIKTESMDLFSTPEPRLLHAAMGMNTEVIELLLPMEDDHINVKEEMGDVLWYAALACDRFEIDFDDLRLLADTEAVHTDALRALLYNAGEFLDQMKRVCFYGVDLDDMKIGRHVANVVYAIQLLASECGWTMEDLQEANIAKLRSRYGDKFTTEAAVNRDLDAEREALEC